MYYGGAIFVFTILLGFIASVLFFRKLWILHSIQINTGELVKGLINILKKGNTIEAISMCEDTPGPAAIVLRNVILHYEQGDKELERASEDTALTEIPKLESGMNLLATIAYIAPLLGLLGTVIGMIAVFQVVSNTNEALINIKDLSTGIYTSLYTTAAGLCVAIPAFLAYNYLLSRIETIILDMEKASLELIYFFDRNKKITKENPSDSNDKTPYI